MNRICILSLRITELYKHLWNFYLFFISWFRTQKGSKQTLLQTDFAVFATLLHTSPPHLNKTIYPKPNLMMPQVTAVQFCDKQLFCIQKHGMLLRHMIPWPSNLKDVIIKKHLNFQEFLRCQIFFTKKNPVEFVYFLHLFITCLNILYLCFL